MKLPDFLKGVLAMAGILLGLVGLLIGILAIIGILINAESCGEGGTKAIPALLIVLFLLLLPIALLYFGKDIITLLQATISDKLIMFLASIPITLILVGVFYISANSLEVEPNSGSNIDIVYGCPK